MTQGLNVKISQRVHYLYVRRDRQGEGRGGGRGSKLGKINNIEHSGAVSVDWSILFIQCHAGVDSPPYVM